MTNAHPDDQKPGDITREPIHTRHIDFQGFRRSDGLFEVEGRMTDCKPQDFTPPGSPRTIPANELIHDIRIRVAFDLDMIVRKVTTSLEKPRQREIGRTNVCRYAAPSLGRRTV